MLIYLLSSTKQKGFRNDEIFTRALVVIDMVVSQTIFTF